MPNPEPVAEQLQSCDGAEMKRKCTGCRKLAYRTSFRPLSFSASTTDFTRWALWVVVTSSASSVSTTTMSVTPIREMSRLPC